MYRGPHATRTVPPKPLRALPWLLGGFSVIAQISWAFVESPAREAVTSVVVVTFALATLTHAAIWRGVGWTIGFALITISVASGAEILGVNTGIPFGRYEYTDSLFPTALGVPIIIPLAWLMMTYPAFLIARKLARSWWAVALVGALALTSWDLFLDPQMVGAEYWRWVDSGVPLAGLQEIPWSNFLGWFAVSLIIMLLLDLLPNKRTSDLLPAALYTWTWLGSIVANLVVFERPYVALWGGLAMGIVTIAFWVKSLRSEDSPFAT